MASGAARRTTPAEKSVPMSIGGMFKFKSEVKKIKFCSRNVRTKIKKLQKT